MPPGPTSGELWGSHMMPDQVDIEFLLPTGFMVTLQIFRSVTLKELKEAVWNEARIHPLFDMLENRDVYVLVGIMQTGEEEEFYDETRRLCDLRLAFLALKVVLPEGNKVENILNSQIGQCIGMPVSDLTRMANAKEVSAFRRSLIELSKANMDILQQGGAEKQASYLYGAAKDDKLLVTVKTALQSVEYLHLYVVSKIPVDDTRFSSASSAYDENAKFTIQLNKTATVQDALMEILRKHHRRPRETLIEDTVSKYALKLCCSMSYMMDLDSRLMSYRHIQGCLVDKRIPILQVVLRKDVSAVVTPCNFVTPTYAHNRVVDDLSNQDPFSLWMVNEFFSVTVKCGRYVSSKEPCKLYVRAGVYHGSQPVVLIKKTRDMPGTNPNWNEKLEFPIYLPDIPRAARLCLALVKRSERKSKPIEFPVGWVNLNLFNHLDCLLKGKLTLPLFEHNHNIDTPNFLHPEGHIYRPNGSPIVTGSSSDITSLVVEFREYHHNPVVFPSYDDVLTHGDTTLLAMQSRHDPTPPTTLSHKEIVTKIKEIALRDPLSEILEQEKVFLWTNRELCRSQPSCLPRLAQSVKWSSRDDVAVFHHLLNRWSCVPSEIALELLGISYMDADLRRFSVYCLSLELSDSELLQYLLQLTQVLKFEPYLDNDLTKFLLKRALEDANIGMAFFWYLRSEIQQAEVRLRYGVILEALCRGCGPLLDELTQQTEALDKLAFLSQELKKEKEEEQKSLFRKRLKENDVREAVEHITSPLDRTHKLGKILEDHCDIKKSKKRPLWLVWTNEDPLAKMHISDYRLIFKHGDDLRQDMLTLQLIRIMDGIWKEEGMDMKLVPYSCLATGNEMGLIEAVRDAETVMSIQKKQFTSAIQLETSQLHRWIKDGNPGELYDRAIDTFTRSCAGYCVATFVLGIRDRHPDNIMLNKNGQLFHIDFGHFLNNRKKKFGINRERVPFVLTEDFVCVIARGANDRPDRSKYLEIFMNLCREAYLVLRKHAKLFLTLFTMMLHCGIPELQAVTDLEYLRKTLAVESNDEEALEYFNSKLNEAYSNAWTTKMDWFSHWINTKN